MCALYCDLHVPVCDSVVGHVATRAHAEVADSNSGASDEKYIARQFAVATVIPFLGRSGV